MTKIFLILIFLYSCGKPIVDKSEFVPSTHPVLKGVSEEIILEGNMSLNFDLLPLKGEAYTSGNLWSGDAWRLNRGAINYRWNSADKVGFDYLSPTPRELNSIPFRSLKELSPAEKYDIYMGRYDYPLKMEVDWLARSGVASWEGLCHGWAGATINHVDPESIIKRNPDGIDVPFGSSDIKALLTYAYSKIIIQEGEITGKRCEEPENQETDNCNEDLTAITFHAVLTNKLGLRGESFIADVDRYQEVWNHPITSYESEILDIKKVMKEKIVTVSTKIAYLDIVEENSWDKINNIYSYMTMKYELKLDQNGNMIDSKWITMERPDFLWKVKKAKNFDGYLSGVMGLLK